MFYYYLYNHRPYPPHHSTILYTTLFHQTHLNPNAKPFFSTTSITMSHPEPETQPKIHKSSLSPTFRLPHHFLPPSPTPEKHRGRGSASPEPVNPETAKVVNKLSHAPEQACLSPQRVVVRKWVPRVNLGGKTTVMIKNIPNKFLRSDLVDMLDVHCRLENEKALKAHPHDHDQLVKSQFDFLYLPIDFKRNANKGYAFVNMTSSAGAVRLCRAFHNFKWEVHKSNKICQVAIAKIQGRDALKKRFKNTVFECNTDEYLPLLFSPPRDGSSEPTSPPLLVGMRHRAT